MISKTSAMMSDPYLLHQENARLKDENDALVAKMKRIDIENKKSQGKTREMEALIQEQMNKIAKILYVVDIYKGKLDQHEPGFELPKHVLSFLS